MLYQAELLPVPKRPRRKNDTSPRRYHARSMAELLLASQNPGKLEEMRALAAGLPFRVIGPREIGILEAPEETGASFLENARIKALAYARRSGRLTVADDSGLSVDALGGAPGLYSSRFGGEGASDLDRNRLLLAKLAGVPPERRGARFTSAVAVARDGEVLFEVEEHVDGQRSPTRCGARAASATTRSSSTRRSAGPSARWSGPRRTASATAARPSRACETSSRGWARPG